MFRKIIITILADSFTFVDQQFRMIALRRRVGGNFFFGKMIEVLGYGNISWVHGAKIRLSTVRESLGMKYESLHEHIQFFLLLSCKQPFSAIFYGIVFHSRDGFVRIKILPRTPLSQPHF